jgi:hypothetical protein
VSGRGSWPTFGADGIDRAAALATYCADQNVYNIHFRCNNAALSNISVVRKSYGFDSEFTVLAQFWIECGMGGLMSSKADFIVPAVQ